MKPNNHITMKTKHALCGLLSGLLLLAAGTAQTHASLIGFHVDPNTGDVNVNRSGETGIKKITGNLYFDTSTGLASSANLVFDTFGAPLYFATAGYFGSQFYGGSAAPLSPGGSLYYLTAQSQFTSRTGMQFTLDTHGDMTQYYGQNLTMVAGFNSVFYSAGDRRNWTDIPILNLTFVPDIPVSPVPEPGTALFGMACVGVSAFRRRRRA